MRRQARELLIVLTLALLGVPAPASAQQASCAAFDSQVWAQSVFVTDPTRYAARDLRLGLQNHLRR